jgi:hypothetical protein
MKTTQTVLLLLLPCFLLSSKCKKDYTPPCTPLQLDNKTDRSLYVVLSYDYPDTSLNFQNPRVNPNTNRIAANSKATINPEPYATCMDGYFDYHPIEKISVFVFDAALVDVTPWNQIRQNYQVLKRFDLGKNEITSTLTLP